MVDSAEHGESEDPGVSNESLRHVGAEPVVEGTEDVFLGEGGQRGGPEDPGVPKRKCLVILYEQPRANILLAS